jgi:hypothetical protein
LGSGFAVVSVFFFVLQAPIPKRRELLKMIRRCFIMIIYCKYGIFFEEKKEMYQLRRRTPN